MPFQLHNTSSTPDHAHELASAVMEMEKGVGQPNCFPAGKLLFINPACELAKFWGKYLFAWVMEEGKSMCSQTQGSSSFLS